ncbi:MAG: bifunctional oligoribonuclease/PAP phosphatase NrnA [Bacteroides sp.]|nr:bifunctional oligoribonuclease/PAP phosphatase NrnA [Prevotella sp.]MCM1408301.1 bifunctional oligoribonuclease/PAP phosphatase NrnA [Treponema brennaborense]MCM1470467.1 bifunctional oligoribonuclease/PAP phosphatase NrnA [Bacteroides sp.]
MEITAEQLAAFVRFIDSHDSFIVSGHKEPDGDSISSAIVLAKLLEKRKKQTQLLSAGPFKRIEIKKFENLFSKKFSPPEDSSASIGLFMLDCSEKERLGDIITKEQFDGLDIFIIDHHKTSECASSSGIIHPSAPATAYLIQLLYEKIIGKPDKETADILFFGMCTDTGFFRFLDCGSTEFFKAAARLVESGANPRATYTDMTSGKPFSTRKLLGVLLERAEQKFDGKLIVTYETLEDTHKYGHAGRDSDSLYQLLLSADNTEAVLFIRQDTEHSCTAGFRSKDAVDVSAIAAVFGGGGHKNAAGLSTEGKISTLLPLILQEFSKIF